MNNVQEVIIDRQYSDTNGAEFCVISKGTGGVVVEYHDGKVELISPDQWEQIGAAPTSKQ